MPPSPLAFSPFFSYPIRFPGHVGTVFPRLSTRHLFAGAIWKFNACALARKITAIPTHPPLVVRNYLSRFPTSPRTYTFASYTYIRARAHPVFPPSPSSSSLGNSDRTLSSHLSLARTLFPCIFTYTRIRVCN